MSDTLITIGITCYREGDLLRECWESVLAQTDDRWVAVFVMDGGADEKTREVFASIEHPKIVKKFAFEENVGPYPVRNKAFELTETPYHFYLDGDDMLPPGCIAAMYRTLEAHPDAAYVYGDYEEFPFGRRIPRPLEVSGPGAVLAITAGWGLYRVGSWRDSGGFAEAFARGGADLDLKISFFERGHPMYHCEEVFYTYRSSRDSGVFGKRQRTLADVVIKTVERHPVFFADAAVRDEFLKWGICTSIRANIYAGHRIAALRYVVTGFRFFGFLRRQFWVWAFYVLLGKSGMELGRKIRNMVGFP